MYASLRICIFGIDLDIDGSTGSLTIGDIFSMWWHVGYRVKGASFFSAGWTDGIKGAFEVRVRGTSIGSSIPFIHEKYRDMELAQPAFACPLLTSAEPVSSHV